MVIHLHYATECLSFVLSQSLLTMCYGYVREVGWRNISPNGDQVSGTFLSLTVCMNLQSRCERNQPQPQFFISFCIYFLLPLVVMLCLVPQNKTTNNDADGRSEALYWWVFIIPLLVHLYQMPLDIFRFSQ